MSRFLAHVQLTGSPTPAQYERLHASMARVGYSRTIAADDGIHYNLPPATYVSSDVDSDVGRQSELIYLFVASPISGQPAEVLVSIYTEAAWRLPEAPRG